MHGGREGGQGMSRECPRCARRLREVGTDGATVHGCESCGGVWLPYGQWQRLCAAEGALVRADERFRALARATQVGGSMRCADCEADLRPFRIGHEHSVELFSCPACQGIWADDGHLAMAERFVRATANAETGCRACPAVALSPRVPCPRCNEPNYPSELVCWACGTALQGRQGAMLCPGCEQPLADTMELGRRLFVCLRCAGVWVGPGMAHHLVACSWSELCQVEQGLLARVGGGLPGVGPVVDRPEPLCPECQVELRLRTISERQCAQVRWCPDCLGLWLEQGKVTLVYYLTNGDREPHARPR